MDFVSPEYTLTIINAFASKGWSLYEKHVLEDTLIEVAERGPAPQFIVSEKIKNSNRAYHCSVFYEIHPIVKRFNFGLDLMIGNMILEEEGNSAKIVLKNGEIVNASIVMFFPEGMSFIGAYKQDKTRLARGIFNISFESIPQILSERLTRNPRYVQENSALDLKS